MELECLVERSKTVFNSSIKWLLLFIRYGILLYYCVGLLSNIFYSCLSYLHYIMEIMMDKYLKEIVDHGNNLCFDLLKHIYEQSANIKSISDINGFWENKNEPRFDSCKNGVSTVLSRHCSRLGMSNPTNFANQENFKEPFLGLGNCVSTISSVMNDYCSWTETVDAVAQNTNIRSLFDYFSFYGGEQYSFKEGSSFANCERELAKAISQQCDWLVTKPIKLAFIFNNFETLCFERKKNLSVKLCVDGLYSVVTHNCAWVKMRSIIVNEIVSKLSQFSDLFIDNVMFLPLYGILGYVTFKTLVYIYEKSYFYYFYNNDMLKKYPLKTDDIILVNNQNSNQEEAIIELMNRIPPEFNVVGLDCEIASGTTNQGQPCPALLQMARPDGHCAIFQLYHLQHRELTESILNNNNTLLVGVGVLNDVNNLKRGWNLNSKRCLDIRHLADDLYKYEKYNGQFTLKNLAGKVLGVKIKKNIKHGPWEQLPLTEHQIIYAAQDARLSVQIFMDLNNKKIHQNFSWFKRLFWNEKTYWKYTLSLWKEFIDKHYNPSQGSVHTNDSLSKSLPPGDSSFQITYKPESSRLPPAIENNYLRICVVCGTKEGEISQKAIVPLEYRVKFCYHLPHYLDLCRNCLIINQKEDFTLRNYLADVCGAPFPIYNTEKLLFVKMLTKEILYKKNRLNNPDVYANVNDLIGELSIQLAVSPIKMTLKNLETILNMDCWHTSPHSVAVCQFVDEYDTDSVDLMRRVWCDHFMETMKPNFLPESWRRFYRNNKLLIQPYIE